MMRFLRRYGVRVLISAMLVLMLYCVVAVWMPYRRDRRAELKLDEFGAWVTCRYCGPKWIPAAVANRLVFLNRVQYISFSFNSELSTDLLTEVRSLDYLKGLTLNSTRITDEGMAQLSGSATLEVIHLSHTDITDAGVEHLKRMPRLNEISLDGTKVSDTGLEHLKGLTNLVTLDLHDTPTTPEGRDKFRKALPNCMITPIP